MSDTPQTHHAAAGRKGAEARWSKLTDPEERRQAMDHVTKGRVRAQDVVERVDQVGDNILAELRAISARLDAIESRGAERVAA
jgi:hypothetical protein